MYGRRTRRFSRSRRARRGRGSRNIRRIAWRTALATHEGTRISRITDRTLLPPTGTTSTLFKRWDPVSESSVAQLWTERLKPDDVIVDILEQPQGGTYWNWRIPEFYAFRDGLHLRGRYNSTAQDYFLPVPGPTPHGPHNIADLNDDARQLAATECSKCINISPGTMWNLFGPYAGIQRGDGRGMRDGPSIRSMKLSVGVTLTPAVIDIPVVDVPDADYLLPNTDIRGVPFERAARVAQFKSSFNSVRNSARTSYVVPTWATVIIFSYRKDARDIELQDPNASLTKSFDRPYAKSNTLYWIRNRHRRLTVDEYGNRVMEPAERWAGHDQPTLDAGGTRYRLYGGPDEDGTEEYIASADWTVPSLKQRRILYPTDIEIDKSIVKIHKIQTVRFNQPTTVLHDTESTLQPRWSTGQQYDWEYGPSNQAYLGTGLTLIPGTVGTSDPPNIDSAGFLQMNQTIRNPGLLSLQKPPNVKSKSLRFQFNFNGKRIEFDDTVDDDRTVTPVWVTAPGAQPNARQAATTTDATYPFAQLDLASQQAVTNVTGTTYKVWTVGSGVPQPTDVMSWGALYNSIVLSTTPANGATIADQTDINVVTGATVGDFAAKSQLAVPVKRWQHYGDNTPYNNLYMTVITPCYKWPVVSATTSDDTVDVPMAFAVPNWGSAPVKVEVGTSFWFKK